MVRVGIKKLDTGLLSACNPSDARGGLMQNLIPSPHWFKSEEIETLLKT
jgi:hypothetical protein